MLPPPAELTRRYEALLRQQAVAREHRPYYLKWMRYYWDFCHKYGFEPRAHQSFLPFDEKLRTKKQSASSVNRCGTRSHFTMRWFWGIGTAGNDCGRRFQLTIRTIPLLMSVVLVLPLRAQRR